MADPIGLPVPTRDPGAASRLADAILRRPEFRPPHRNPIELVRDAFGRFIGRVLGSLVGGGFSTLGLIALVALVAVVVFASIRAARAVRPSAGAAVDVAIDERKRPAADWRADAERLEAEGDWRNGLRCRFRALVAALAALGLVDEVPGRTAGEYRRNMALALPAAASAFAGATELFERSWYGRRDTGPAESARFAALAEEVMQSAGGRIPVPAGRT